jgi:drug/metabolite transporter (DMT)-like permease
VYSNLVPVVAMIVAAVFLDEPITPMKVAGAAAILAGLALTRIGPSDPAVDALHHAE